MAEYSASYGSMADGYVVRSLSGSFSVSSALASEDFISIGKLPKGARIVKGGVVVHNITSGATVKLGDKVDDDRYGTLTGAGSATENNISPVASGGYIVGTSSGDDLLRLTAGGVVSSGGRIDYDVRFVIEN